MNETADDIVTYMLADLNLTVAAWQRKIMVDMVDIIESENRRPDPSAFHFVSF